MHFIHPSPPFSTISIRYSIVEDEDGVMENNDINAICITIKLMRRSEKIVRKTRNNFFSILIMEFTPYLIEATANNPLAAVISCVRPYSSRPIIIDVPFNRLPHRTRILVQVTINRRLLIGPSRPIREYGPSVPKYTI